MSVLVLVLAAGLANQTAPTAPAESATAPATTPAPATTAETAGPTAVAGPAAEPAKAGRPKLLVLDVKAANPDDVDAGQAETLTQFIAARAARFPLDVVSMAD